MNKAKNQGMSERLSIRIDKETKEEFKARLESEGKIISDVVILWIKDYLASGSSEGNDLEALRKQVNSLNSKVNRIEEDLLGKLPA